MDKQIEKKVGGYYIRCKCGQEYDITKIKDDTFKCECGRILQNKGDRFEIITDLKSE